MAIELKPDFFDRCARQQQDVMGMQGPYAAVLGDYTLVQLVKDPDYAAARLEPFWAGHIRACLKADPTRRVISYDAGGGISVMSLKLAALLQDEIRDGRFLPVVSELSGGPEHFLEVAKALVPQHGNSYQVSVAAAMLKEFRQGVCYTETALSGNNTSVVWQGEEIDLAGGVDFIHESCAVTPWSRIPEWHILGLGRLASPRCVYAVHQDDIHELTGWMDKAGVERAQRHAGIVAAHRALQEQFGLTPVDHVEAGAFAGRPMTYRIFKGPEAPPITVG